jgi:hypothetical protein
MPFKNVIFDGTPPITDRVFYCQILLCNFSNKVLINNKIVQNCYVLCELGYLRFFLNFKSYDFKSLMFTHSQ